MDEVSLECANNLLSGGDDSISVAGLVMGGLLGLCIPMMCNVAAAGGCVHQACPAASCSHDIVQWLTEACLSCTSSLHSVAQRHIAYGLPLGAPRFELLTQGNCGTECCAKCNSDAA